MTYSRYLTEQKAYALTVIKNKVRELRAQGKDVIDMTLGDPADDTSQVMRESMISYLESNTSSSYPITVGNSSYLNAVSAWAKREYNLTLNPDTNILSCIGTKEAICTIPLVYDWSDKKEIFFPSLSYPVYKSSAQLLNITYRELPVSKETQFLPDLDLLDESDWLKCKIFWLNSPHNPTGVIASKEYCLKVLDLAEKYDFLIASDEAYMDLFYKTRCFSFLETDSQNWIVFRTLSKRNNMTGFRAGAMITKNEELRNMIAKMRLPMGLGLPEAISAGAEKVWLDNDHIKLNRTNFKKKRDLLVPALESLGCKIASSDYGFCLWFSHDNYSSSNDLWNAFAKNSLILVPGTSFGKSGDGYIRMSFACSIEDCEKAVKILSEMSL